MIVILFLKTILVNEMIIKKFSRNFTSRSQSWGIFNSLFTLDFETFSFHFSLSILISRHFHFTFHSRNEWTRFSFHFSLLKMSEPDFHFTFHFSNFQYPLLQNTGGQRGVREARLTMQLQSIYFKKATIKTMVILVRVGWGMGTTTTATSHTPIPKRRQNNLGNAQILRDSFTSIAMDLYR